MAELKAVIYLESNKLSIYMVGMEHPISLAFSTAGMANMEVLDKELIYNQIQTFAVSNKLTPCICSIILSNEITFQKVIRQTQQTQKAELIQEFLKNVPFDNVSHILYDSADTSYVFATNDELFTTIRRGFEKFGYEVDAVIPVALFANANIPAGSLISTQSATYLLDNVDAVKQFNFINVREETAIRAAKKSNSRAAKKDKKREKILGGVFAGLLVVLLVVFLTSNNSVAPTGTEAAPDLRTQSTEFNSSTVQPVPQAPRTDGKDAIKIKIVNTQQSEDGAGIIKNALSQAGFTSIENESTVSAQSSVSFSVSTSETFKNEILTIIRPILPDFTLLSHSEPAINAIIILGE